MCEDYRAAAGIDLVHDAEDSERMITCPLLVLWGSRGVVGTLYDPLHVWSKYATDLRGSPIDAGHFLAEEKPDDVLQALDGFLSQPHRSGD